MSMPWQSVQLTAVPELPEVQTIVNDLHAVGLPGRRITQVLVRWPRTVLPMMPQAFAAAVRGRRVEAVDRRAKYIRIWLDNDTVLFGHLRMSGRLQMRTAADPIDKHEHVVFSLDDGRQLRYYDPRKFGRWYVEAPRHLEDRLGPEPLSPGFGPTQLGQRLAGIRRQIKPTLLDQSVIAGLGNIYVDEALWQARIHPLTPAGELSGPALTALAKAIPLVLQRGLRNLGTSLGTGKANFYSVASRAGRNRDELRVFRRTGLPCPRCGTAIQRLVVGQRSTHICTLCQVPEAKRAPRS